ncbi:MAG: lytic transglycosylase domain-containing protein [Verrucomicrobia bacterium]|nr:lytic transglycosylase domain-containing protein [Verrucomicrobiota bacterium]
MKKLWLALLLLLGTLYAPGQEQPATFDDLMESADQWAKENLDDDVLRALQDVDREKVKQFFNDLQKQLHGQYVVDLAPLQDAARNLLPLLESYEDTQPYAAWLKARLDYIDVADEFRRTLPPPRVVPGQPPKPIPNPAPKVERENWIKKLADRPSPDTAKPYVSRLKPIFTAQNVPPELVWIAEVESSFDPSARSPAGAAGLFQLMPATAKRYGLRTWPLDQRLRPDDSAEATAKYLRYLHGHFKDWRLALAAYNAGEGTVQKLLDRQKARTFDAIATRLPAETQMYVPRIEATLVRREGLKLSQIHLPNG